MAWSGAAPIARVEVSVGEGDWQEARLEGESQRGSWRRWELITRLDQAGASDMRARATDQAGNTQPERRRPVVSIAGAWVTLRRGLACRYSIFVSRGLRVAAALVLGRRHLPSLRVEDGELTAYPRNCALVRTRSGTDLTSLSFCVPPNASSSPTITVFCPRE